MLGVVTQQSCVCSASCVHAPGQQQSRQPRECNQSCGIASIEKGCFVDCERHSSGVTCPKLQQNDSDSKLLAQCSKAVHAASLLVLTHPTNTPAAKSLFSTAQHSSSCAPASGPATAATGCSEQQDCVSSLLAMVFPPQQHSCSKKLVC